MRLATDGGSTDLAAPLKLIPVEPLSHSMETSASIARPRRCGYLLGRDVEGIGSIPGPRFVLLAERPDSSRARIHAAYLCTIDRRGADAGYAMARRGRWSQDPGDLDSGTRACDGAAREIGRVLRSCG